MLVRSFGAPPLAPTPAWLPDPQLFAIGLGVVGGLFVGQIIYKQVFVEGLTSEERKNLLLFAAASATMWGIQQIVDLEKVTTELGNQVGIPDAGQIFK
jgi:hypothetical protein